MDKLLDRSVDLESLFDLSFDASTTETTTTVDSTWKTLKCHKCNGTGNFIGYTGRIVGPCFTCNGKGIKKEKPAPVAGNTVDVSKIVTALNTAFSNGKKRPKLRLGAFTFSRAPDTGKNPGAIYVKKGMAYLGKVVDGEFHPVRDCDDDTTKAVIEVASKPLESAVAYGFKTGICACCGITLTNPESIKRGIGPICAEKFGF
jgi:hypothetical protein